MTNFLTIMAAINAALNAAPGVQALVQSTKEWITSLFVAEVITQAEQEKLMAWCDDYMNAVVRGEKPPQLEIDPD